MPFTGQVSTACGTAGAAVGPFYCPGDSTVYLDTGFFDQLTSQFSTQGGDAAEAYVFAHEFGHHIQNLTGVMAKVQSQGSRCRPGPSPVASGWSCRPTATPACGSSTPRPTRTRRSRSSARTTSNRAVDAAAAVGDDRIQERMQGQVNPESWTHGSAANRQKWLNYRLQLR